MHTAILYVIHDPHVRLYMYQDQEERKDKFNSLSPEFGKPTFPIELKNISKGMPL